MSTIIIDSEILSPDTVAKLIRDLQENGYSFSQTTNNLIELLKSLVGDEDAFKMIKEER